jgi:hypothetical protein
VAPRRGVGRLLFAAAERRLLADGIRYLTVKTLSATDPQTQIRNDAQLLRGNRIRAPRGAPNVLGQRQPVPLACEASDG